MTKLKYMLQNSLLLNELMIFVRCRLYGLYYSYMQGILFFVTLSNIVIFLKNMFMVGFSLYLILQV
jgi:hypothetical protein